MAQVRGGKPYSKPLLMLGLAVVATTATAFAVKRVHSRGLMRLASKEGGKGGVGGSSKTRPPVPKMVPHKVLFGKVEGENRGENPMDPPKQRVDNYFWMRDDDRKDKEVIAHIEAENAFTEGSTAHLAGLRDSLYNEFLSHIKETDDSVPYPRGPYTYFSRTVKGLSYSIHCRRPKGQSEEEGEAEVTLDVNKLAEGKKYCDVSCVSPSPNHELIAYGVDFTGNETYEVKIRDTTKDEHLEDVLKETAGDLVWGADSSTIYYTTQDEELRPYKLWRHAVGTSQEEDVCLFTEEDQLLTLGIGKTDSERFLILSLHAKTTDESHFIDLEGVQGAEQHAAAQLVLVQGRTPDLRYNLEHHGDSFWIITNKDGCRNGKLVHCKIETPSAENWVDEESLPYDPLRKLDYAMCFKGHMALSGREKGLKQLWVRDMKDGSLHTVEHPEPSYNAYTSNNFEFDTETLRFVYSSMVTPKSTFDYNMSSRSRQLLKADEVPNYDPSLYVSERSHATAKDGTTQIPLSIVYRKDLYPDGLEGKQVPTMLYGYGSYGACMEPDFSALRLSFLDRGMAYVIAHIRGGGEMGRYWYEDEGKFLTKRNTFEDFVASAEHLIQQQMTTPSNLAICGRSAGGMLMGAVANMAPQLFKCVVSDVCFVDVMNTMSDATIPLTCQEWEEWGNPNEEKYHDYMLSYSPYDNVVAQAYPDMLITGGFHDPRVAYWEPTKWAAKLRELNTGKSTMLVKIDMSSGHFSASDRYKYLKEYAFEYAYVVDQLDCASLASPVQAAAPAALEAEIEAAKADL